MDNSDMPDLDHWGNRSKDFLLPFFRNAKKIVKIASGFFTVQGFNIIADALEGTTTFILVGYDDTQNKNLVGKLLADVKEDLKRWEHYNRLQVVRLLLAKLRKQEIYFRENDDDPYADTRIRKNDHGKVYIIDDKIVFSGSVNTTMKGLVYNEEASGGITEPKRVARWVNWFDEKWNDPDTKDLTQLLFELLDQWLKFVSPFDIYLKSIQVLVEEESPNSPRSDYKLPAPYQQVIIKRVVRQLKTFRGAMLVASTGTGKTVMAIDVCHHLRNAGLIDTVLVFAPKHTHMNWEDGFDSAGINSRRFSREILSQNTSGDEGRRLERYLDRLDDKYVIIIDESQYFRNENKQGGKQKLSFKRLLRRVNESGCYVLLLTATPFAKGFEDINAQLKLLPHHAPQRTTTSSGQKVFPNMGIIEYPNAWYVPDEEYLQVFRKLEVVTLVSTSWIAKNFGISTDEGDYVNRPDGRVWIPHLYLSKINIPLPFEKQIKDTLKNRYFRHMPIPLQTRDGSYYMTDKNVEDLVNQAWASSPKALEETLYRTIHDIYEYEFVHSPQEREFLLSPIYRECRQLKFLDDPKFYALQEILVKHRNEKVIIFTERKPTAVYLYNAIRGQLPERNVDTTIIQTDEYEYDSVDDKTLQDMIRDFAPLSNQNLGSSERDLDILILTDAHSTGINLQDASVMINYDLAWTADVIIQRAGRIMRFWQEPRQVYLYTFVGVFEYDEVIPYDASRVSQRFRSLSLRAKDAQQISELPILPDVERQRITSLGDFSKVTIEDIGEIDAKEVEEYSGGSPFLRHITAHKQNEERANSLRDDISSAKLYDGLDHLVYVLLRHQGEYIWLVYNISRGKMLNVTNDELLELLECDAKTEVASIDPDELEIHAQQLRLEWCDTNNIQQDEVERICALYLKPRHEEDSLENLIQTDAETWQ